MKERRGSIEDEVTKLEVEIARLRSRALELRQRRGDGAGVSALLDLRRADLETLMEEWEEVVQAIEAIAIFLTEADVLRLLPMRDCIDLMRTAFERLASGEAIEPSASPAGPADAIGPALHGGERRRVFRRQGLLDQSRAHPPHFLLPALPRRRCRAARRHRGQPPGPDPHRRGQRVRDLAAGSARFPDARGDRRRGSRRGRRWKRSGPRCRPSTGCGSGAGRPRSREAFAPRAESKRVATAEAAVRGADIVVTATSSAEPVVARRLDRSRDSHQRNWLKSGKTSGVTVRSGPTGGPDRHRQRRAEPYGVGGPAVGGSGLEPGGRTEGCHLGASPDGTAPRTLRCSNQTG